ncbi:MAG: hypothetical protein ABIP20_01850 [Chthoniobacteraceae bacterium]
MRVAANVCTLLVCSGILSAAEPVLNHLSPVAGQQGTTVTLTAAGKFDPWPAQVWVDAPGITFKPSKTAGKFDVEIAKDAVPGPHLVRVFNASGASAPRFFIVASEPQTLEVEPNDDFHSPQKIATLPATIGGKLDKAGDVDSFAVTLKRGQTLVAWMEAYVLAATFDGILRITDTDGHELAFNHDGRTLDSFLAWTAPRDGTFIVQIMGFAYPATSGVTFTGGDGCVYRLHLTAGPFVRHTLPLAVARGKMTPVELAGWNLTSTHADIDGTRFPAQGTAAELGLPGVASHLPVIISDIPEILEKEPNNTAATAQAVEVPVGITGRSDGTNDEDRFAFHAVKGRAYEFNVTAARIGSPLDAWLKIENKDGKQLATNDDAGGSRDPELTWTAPADGTFMCAVGDVSHHGGDDYFYRLAITDAAPSVNATVTFHSASLQAGKSAELKVAVKRTNGFKAKLQLTAKNLPDGVTAPPADVPEKDGEVTLKLSASADAKPASQPFTVVLREAEGGTEHPANFFMTTSSENNGVPQGYTELVIPSTEQLWLAVLMEPPKIEPAKADAKK